MKKILITGANSYIGTSFEKYIQENYSERYKVNTVDMVGNGWRNEDFSGYDAVFHVAGIAHSDTRKVSKEAVDKYYKINADLTVETAQKAKAEGVRQFVFMSSMIVFGSKNEHITWDTKPEPDNFYGDSKLRADMGIHKLEGEGFKVVSIRSPMIYGKNSKGNFRTLVKFAKLTPVFPEYDNKRSMIYIENLCNFIRLVIDNNESGYFYPQNSEYVKTSDMVKAIGKKFGRKVIFTKAFNPVILIFRKHPIIKKVFGNLYYDMSMSEYKDEYREFGFDESIERTENV